MDDDTRHAVHKALDDVARPSPRQMDVYAREAEAWLVAGMTRRDAVDRVTRELALNEIEHGLHANRAIFTIEHSAVHSHLELFFCLDSLQRYQLIAINGQPTD